MSLSKTYFNNHSTSQLPRHLMNAYQFLCEATEDEEPFIYRKGIKLIMNQKGWKLRNAQKVLKNLESFGAIKKLGGGYSGHNAVYEILIPEPCNPKKGCTQVHTFHSQRVHSDSEKGALKDEKGCTLIPERVHSGAENKPSLNLSKSEVKRKDTSPEQLFTKVMELVPFGSSFYYDRNLEEEFTQLLKIESLTVEAIAWAITYHYPKFEIQKQNQLPITHLKKTLKVILEAPQLVLDDFAKVQANKARAKQLEESEKVDNPVNLSEKIAGLVDTLGIK